MSSYSANNTARIESEDDAIESGETNVALCLSKITQALEDEEPWRKQARIAVKVYEADSDADGVMGYSGRPIFNIFHSNIQTLRPAVFNSTPIPDVRRKFGDKDEVARLAAQIAERALGASLDCFDFDSVMKADILDALTAGRGLSRVRYVPYFAPAKPKAKDGAESPDGGEFDVVTHEEVVIEHIGWDRYVQGPARDWLQVPWVAFQHDLTKEEVYRLLDSSDSKTRGGKSMKERLEGLSFGGQSQTEDGSESKTWKGILKTIPVWEVWDKASRSVLFLTDKDRDLPLAVIKDPLKLTGFFPNPAPIQQSRRSSSLLPICPYTVYADLIAELEETSQRIQATIRDMRVRALADPKLNNDLELLAKATDGEVVSASAAEMFMSGGPVDIKALVLWWPVEMDVAVLQQLMAQRDSIKQVIYEVTGLSDIIRGAEGKQQTATEVNTKATWGSQRVQDLQQEVARYAKDLFRLMAEVIFIRFQDDTIRHMTLLPEPVDQEEIAAGVAAQFQPPTGATGAPQPPSNGPPSGQLGQPPVAPVASPAPDPGQVQAAQQQAIQQAQQAAEQAFVKALQVLRDQLRFFRVDIETDSTIKATIQSDQTQVTAFFKMTSDFLASATGLAQIAPPMLAPMVEIWSKVAGRSFKMGKGADDVLEKIVEAAHKSVEQGLQGNGPSADQQAAQQQAEAAADQAKQQHEADMQQRDQQHDSAMQALSHQAAQRQQQHDATIAAMTQAQEHTSAERDAMQAQVEREHAELSAQHDKVMAILDSHKDVLKHNSAAELIRLKDVADAMKARRSMVHEEHKAKLAKAKPKPKPEARA